jgi:hypothetical protein
LIEGMALQRSNGSLASGGRTGAMAQPQASSCRVAVLQSPLDIGDTRSFITSDNEDAVLAPLLNGVNNDLANPSIPDDVARHLRDGNDDNYLIVA